MKFTIRSALLVAATLVAMTASGQSKNAREALFRCRDANGELHVGSAMPVECQGIDTEVLSQRGNVIRLIEGAATKAKRLAAEEAAAAAQKEKEDRLQRDRVLIDTYLTVEDIERLRDQRLDLLEAQLKVAEQHISTLKDRVQRLRQQAARFKPYADKPNAPPLPDHIAEEMINTLKSVAVDQQTIDIKRNEQATLTTQFASDIKRFKELKGLN